MKRYFPILLLLALSAGFAVAQDPSGPPSTQAKKYTIENCLNPFDTTRIIPTSVGYQYWFIAQKFLEDGLTVKMSVVAPRQATHPPHQHEGDEIFFVLEGTAQFFLDGKTTTGGAYASFYCPAGSEHGISNAGSTELKYLVIRKYPVN
ncbi:MAG TPA: cupin domain-containing protein [Prolixibacteraceae bacterium]|nr:cupin domain-containing protein [Prolixibacteraceae bacterium]